MTALALVPPPAPAVAPGSTPAERAVATAAAMVAPIGLKELNALATMTPDRARAAAQKWMSRPAYTLIVEKGEREGYEEAKAVAAAPAGRASSKRRTWSRR